MAVQIPETMQTVWDWDDWVYTPGNGQVVNKTDPTMLIPYNYVVFSVSRYEGGSWQQYPRGPLPIQLAGRCVGSGNYRFRRQQFSNFLPTHKGTFHFVPLLPARITPDQGPSHSS